MKKNLIFPLTDEREIESLRAGDEVYIDGHIIGCRDASLMRIFDEKTEPEIDLKNAALLHTAPGVRKEGDKFKKICIGTTTSTRMNRFTEGLIRDYHVRAIIGKGGLLEDSASAMRRYKGCYLAITGGAAALETTQIKDIEKVEWEDLMPECLWKFRVKDFGPLVVAIDTRGHSLYEKVRKKVNSNLRRLTAELG